MTVLPHNSSHAGAHRQKQRLPRIGITMGDPAGIGPEIVLKAVAEEDVQRVCTPVIIGDAQLLAHTARTLDLVCGYDIVRRGEPLPDHLPGPVIFHLDNIIGYIEPGIESGAAGKAGTRTHLRSQKSRSRFCLSKTTATTRRMRILRTASRTTFSRASRRSAI